MNTSPPVIDKGLAFVDDPMESGTAVLAPGQEHGHRKPTSAYPSGRELAGHPAGIAPFDVPMSTSHHGLRPMRELLSGGQEPMVKSDMASGSGDNASITSAGSDKRKKRMMALNRMKKFVSPSKH